MRYLEALPVICWSAADLLVIEGGPQYRRRFLDQGIVGRQPAAVEVLSRYRRALEQKRELLRKSAQGLEAWNQVLSEAAADLIGRRASFASLLQESLTETIEASGLGIPDVRLRYNPSPAVSEATAERLYDAFSRSSVRETEEGRVLLGPHRDELVITWGGFEISKIASAGEKKLVGILLCAARGRVLSKAGRHPVVLLDDVDAELDPERLAVAWNLFSSSPQIVATTCHESVIDTLPEAHIWRLETGSIRSL